MSPPHHQVGEDPDPQDGADKRHDKIPPGLLKQKTPGVQTQPQNTKQLLLYPSASIWTLNISWFQRFSFIPAPVSRRWTTCWNKHLCVKPCFQVLRREDRRCWPQGGGHTHHFQNMSSHWWPSLPWRGAGGWCSPSCGRRAAWATAGTRWAAAAGTWPVSVWFQATPETAVRSPPLPPPCDRRRHHHHCLHSHWSSLRHRSRPQRCPLSPLIPPPLPAGRDHRSESKTKCFNFTCLNMFSASQFTDFNDSNTFLCFRSFTCFEFLPEQTRCGSVYFLLF